MAESRLGDRPPAFWQAVEADYFASKLTLLQIRVKHNVTEGEFNHARAELGWKRRYETPASRKTILKRLFRLVDRLTTKLEEEMTTAGEKEVGVLGRLVHTMGKLIEIEDATNRTATPRQTKDMHDIRSKLVARIAELKRG
jgi:hypothetical protein